MPGASGAVPWERGGGRLAYRSGSCRERELPDGVDHTQPDRDAGKIGLRREFFSLLGGFRHSCMAVAGEDQVSDASDLDFRDHRRKGYRASVSLRLRQRVLVSGGAPTPPEAPAHPCAP